MSVAKTYRLGFMMAQVAGHVTNAQNLRRIAAQDPTIEASWCEVSYYRAGGRIEQVADRLGRGHALRPVLELRRCTRGREVDAFFVNTSAATLHRGPFLETPTLVDFDSTPVQLQTMPAYGREPRSRVVEAGQRRVRHQLWSRVALMQAWSEWAKESAVEDYGVDADHIIVNPPGVDLDVWKPATELHPRPDVGTPLKVLFVGGDFERKGGDVLLEWYRRAGPRGVEVHVVTREPVSASPGVIVHHDMAPNSEQLVRLYQQCDLFVLPSRAECFGIATVEAMATGLPVVVSNVGASSEIVDHGRNGYIVQPGHADELGMAIMEILQTEKDRQRMGAASRSIAESRFSLETNARRTLDELKRLAAV